MSAIDNRENRVALGTVAVLGAGLMGAGIAAEYAVAGWDVRVATSEHTTKVMAVERVHAAALGDVIGHVSWWPTTAEATRGAKVVVECLPEDLRLKRGQLAEAQRIAPDAILCTNTSSLTISEIADGLPLPEQLVGTHYLSPPSLFAVVEVIPSSHTSEVVTHRVEQILLGLGKEPLRLLRDTRGFVVNRLQFALIRESLALVDDGVVAPEDLDRIVSLGLGPRWAGSGPLATIELGGSDLFRDLAERMFPELSNVTRPPKDLVRRNLTPAARKDLSRARERVVTNLRKVHR